MVVEGGSPLYRTWFWLADCFSLGCFPPAHGCVSNDFTSMQPAMGEPLHCARIVRYFYKRSPPKRGHATMDCESLTPTPGAAQQSVHCESLTPTRGATQQSVDSEIVPVSSIAPEGWGPKEGGSATSPLHSRGSPNKGGQNQKSKPPLGVTMMPLGAPSISKYGSIVRSQTPK